jgi:prophage tail gpP-like protein
MPPAPSHVVTVIVNGQQIGGWSEYHIESSIITPADSFQMHRPFSADAWLALRRDSDIRVKIDGTTILRGFIDKRVRKAREGIIEISGRDRAGRMVDESAPQIDYSGMQTIDAVKRLASPWFDTVTLSDAKNRILRRGKGRRVASGNEPVVTIGIRTPRHGTVHPGMSRWQVIHEIASRENLMAWSTADGEELFIGLPNDRQAPQYLFAHAADGSLLRGTVTDLVITEDDGDRYSLIMVAGSGGQSDTNYGENVSDNRGRVFDSPFNKIDGTGRDFIHPKRMFMPERDFASFGDAQRVAENEQARRDFHRHSVRVDAPLHGQFLGTASTLFSPNCVARVIDEEQTPTLDDNYLIVSCSYNSTHDQGESTSMHMVPVGTRIIL